MNAIKKSHWGLLAAALFALAPAAALAFGRNDLGLVVRRLCVPDWRHHHLAFPCEAVHDGADGYVILHDVRGGIHFLLVPIARIAGIESPQTWDAAAPNWFAKAWAERGWLERRAGRPIPTRIVALALNARAQRSQDQLHVHIGCVHQTLRRELDALPALERTWTPVRLLGEDFYVQRVAAPLQTFNPLPSIAEQIPGAQADMGRWSVLVAGDERGEGGGFIVLASDGRRAAEQLLDPQCRF